MLSETAQDYMKQIYVLERRDGKATTSALADAMGVSAASVTSMVKKLAGNGLVEHSRYHGVTLTAPGEKVALEVLRHHRLLEVYLTQTLGLSWDKVHSEAERLEHVLSEELEAEIDRALGYPATDPHGDPIPTADLVIAAEPAHRMAELEPGQAAVVRQVPDGDPSLLQYLAGLGLVPDTHVTLLEKAPFGGPLTLDVAGTQHAVGVELAERIRVEVTA
ncbi:MAG TPA: metal-dependent transcriptional regulator [Gaiellales bacterium]|jgi:DtxR family Mn-dependent transcriptional regulator